MAYKNKTPAKKPAKSKPTPSPTKKESRKTAPKKQAPKRRKKKEIDYRKGPTAYAKSNGKKMPTLLG